MSLLESAAAELMAAKIGQLPLPGGGATSQRHESLFEWGRQDLSFARIAEAHTDALAILVEAGHSIRADILYAVWASDGGADRVSCERLATGDWRLSGSKPFCSGATLATAALVTAHHGAEVFLFEVPLSSTGISVQPSQWKSPAFADTATVAVGFEAVMISAKSLLGPANWYLTRPGFWHGAIGPAACWAGGAAFLADAATAVNRSDPHSRAHVGALQAMVWGLRAILDRAGREIDQDPHDAGGSARVRALQVRHLIERGCTEILDRFGRATGPQLLAYDAQVVRQHAALALYIRQCHGERDLETIPDRSARGRTQLQDSG